jgi:hypothetical protein
MRLLLPLLTIFCASAWAAFPTIAGRQTTTSAANTSHTINFDATPTNGDLLLVCASVGGSFASATYSWPGGWSVVSQINSTGAGTTDSWTECAYFVASSTSSSITLGMSPSLALVARAIRFQTGTYTGTPFAVLAGSTGVNSAPDPPALTPAGGAKDFQWITAYGYGAAQTATAYPANYSLGQATTSTGSVGGGWAERQLNAATENPGTFTVTANSGRWSATTLAVSGAGSPAVKAVLYLNAVRRASFYVFVAASLGWDCRSVIARVREMLVQLKHEVEMALSRIAEIEMVSA